MKRRMNLGLMGFGVLAIASAMGCEAQVDDDYTGEALFSLQGNVIVTKDQAGADLVPYLAFPSRDADGSFLALIDGELTGEFPAKFRFDVTQPPSDEALQSMPPQWSFNGKGSMGVIVMLPPNVGERIPFLNGGTIDEECTDDGLQCTRTVRECVGDDRCRERTSVCTSTPCELVEQWGDPELGLTTTGQSTYHCDSESCYSIHSACDDEEGNCRTDVYSCDVPPNTEVDEAFDGMLTTCEVQSETGDTSLLSYDDLNTVAVDYKVIFVTEDSPDALWGPLERGYNLIQAAESTAWLESQKCEIETMEAAVAEYNMEHGTDYRQFDPDIELSDLSIAAMKKCAAHQVIRNPVAEALTIELGKPQKL